MKQDVHLQSYKINITLKKGTNCIMCYIFRYKYDVSEEIFNLVDIGDDSTKRSFLSNIHGVRRPHSS
jgi:hypothetical protein